MAENISSSALFHFTPSMARLKSILKNGFVPKRCLEYTLDREDRIAASRKRPPTNATPMVCFCDIPLSLIRKHMSAYGSYGIGLSKAWGLENNIAPVIYTHHRTHNPFRKLIAQAQKSDDKSMARDLATLAAHTKPWNGPAWRKGRVVPRVQFYDEREWRYVPENFSDTTALRVHPDYIQYLILPPDETENNVLELHRFLMKLYKHRDAILVTTTIMTEDRISEDI